MNMTEKGMEKGNATKGAEKPEEKKGILSRLPTPLKEGIVVAAVAVAAIAIPACGKETRTQIQDGHTDTEEVDEVDGDVEVDVNEEDMIADVPTEDVAEEDAVEEDAPVDAVDEDAEADAPVDAVEEDAVDEDVTAACSAVDGMADVWISAGGTETVGGIGVRYNGQDMFGNGLYDIVCGDVTVRSGIAAAPLTSELVDVPEHSFSVTLRPNTVSSIRSNVTVTVDAY